MLILGYLSAIVIGICLGLVGGGGSILTIPVLVYLFNFSPEIATSYSFFIVCVTSLVGSIWYVEHNLICYKSVVLFGLPSLFMVYITRKFIFPSIPADVHILFMSVHKDVFLMLLFSLVMIGAAYTMIKPQKSIRPDDYVSDKRYNFLLTLLGGILVGFVSGLLATGGGFLIIPALIIFSRMGMKIAIGTSLMIITANTLIGFLSDLHLDIPLNWPMLIGFTLLSVAGILAGMQFSKRVEGYKLKPAFGWFILALATFIISQFLVVSL